MAGELLRTRDILKAGQTLEFYVDEEGDRYPSRILSMTEKELIVLAPVDQAGVPLALNPQMELNCLVQVKDEQYKFQIVLRNESKRGRVSVWHTALPEKVETFQNRSFVRVEVDLPLEIRLISAEGAIGRPMKARMVDLSGGGLCFELNQSVEPGLQVALQINSIPEIGIIDVMARVRRCKPINPKAVYLKYHIGVDFGYLPRSVINRIVHYLFSVQRSKINKAAWLKGR